MKKKILKTIREHDLIQKDMHIVLGLSGGPDSVCLFNVLLEISDEFNLTIHPVHINHRLRPGAAEADQQYVEELCRKKGLECRSFVRDCNELAKTLKMTSEEAGRKVRYEAFYQVAEEVAATGVAKEKIAVAVAQNSNDQCETILFRILRGTGTDGLSGIAYKRIGEGGFAIIRPLLDVSRDEIEKYCESCNLQPRIDHTNKEPIYTRNKIRLNLLPFLAENFNSNIIETINRMGKISAEDSDFIWQEAEKAFCRAVVSETPAVGTELAPTKSGTAQFVPPAEQASPAGTKLASFTSKMPAGTDLAPATVHFAPTSAGMPVGTDLAPANTEPTGSLGTDLAPLADKAPTVGTDLAPANTEFSSTGLSSAQPSQAAPRCQVFTESLKDLHIAVRYRVYNICLNRVGMFENITRAQLKLIEQIIQSESPSAAADLSGGFRVSKAYDRLIFYKEEKPEARPSSELRPSGRPHAMPSEQLRAMPSSQNGAMATWRLRIMTKAEYADFADAAAKQGILFGAFSGDSLAQSNSLAQGDQAAQIEKLRIRTRQDGDYITINGGKKKIQDFFVDCKVPKLYRDEIELLAYGSKVLWVLPSDYFPNPINKAKGRFSADFRVDPEKDKTIIVLERKQNLC